MCRQLAIWYCGHDSEITVDCNRNIKVYRDGSTECQNTLNKRDMFTRCRKCLERKSKRKSLGIEGRGGSVPVFESIKKGERYEIQSKRIQREIPIVRMARLVEETEEELLAFTDNAFADPIWTDATFDVLLSRCDSQDDEEFLENNGENLYGEFRESLYPFHNLMEVGYVASENRKRGRKRAPARAMCPTKRKIYRSRMAFHRTVRRIWRTKRGIIK
jgi:hypothetical protein